MTRAVYWISYILRHQGANHLRSAVYEVSTHQYFLVDVVVTVAAALVLVVFTLYRIGRLLRSKVGSQTRAGEAVARDDDNMANGHCHSDSLANGKHNRNGSLVKEKKMN